MRYLVWACLCLPYLLCATTDEKGIRFFVENGAHMTFSDSPRLFDDCEFIVQRHGVVSVRQQTKKPRITYATLIPEPEAPDGEHRTQHGDMGEASYEFAELEERYKEVQKKLAHTTTALEKVQLAFDDMIAGSYELPNTALSSQDAGRLNRRCAVLEKRFDAFAKWSNTALQNLPLVALSEDLGSEKPLAELIAHSQHQSSSVGTHLVRSVQIPPGRPAVITQNLTLHGDGHSITFAGGTEPELIVASGAQLVLKDITLKNIRARSIILEPGALLRCGPGVTWELHDDITFENGTFELTGGTTVMRMYGIGGTRRLHIGNMAQVKLKTNTWALSNIAVSNAHRISSMVNEREVHGEKVWYCGAVALCGNATLQVADQIDTGVVVVGKGNELVCQTQQLQVNKPVLFADEGYNELFWHMPNDALCIVENEALLVTSEYGQAHLRFKANNLTVRSTQAGWVIGAHGTVHGSHIALEKYPLVVIGAQQPCASGLQVSGMYDNTFAFELPDQFIERKYSAYHIQEREPLALNMMHESLQTGVVKMQAMQGAVPLKNATVTDWGVNVDSSVPLLLELQGNTRLLQGSRPVVIREIDTVSVSGEANEIILTGHCSWHGALRCAANSRLTITCERGATIDLQSVLEKPWDLGSGSVVTLRGPGAVQIKEAFLCQFADSDVAPARLVLSDGIATTVTPRAEWGFAGNGTVELLQFATCSIEPGGRVLVGEHTSDSISIILDHFGTLTVGSTEKNQEEALLSCAYGQYQLLINHGATLQVNNSGVFECNMRDGSVAQGIVQALLFQNKGTLYLADEGRFLLAENRQRPRIEWIQNGGGICGPGLVGMNTMRYQDRIVCGRLQSTEILPTKKTVQMFARNIVASLINITDSLHSTLYFVNSSGTSMIHTKGHVIVPLKPGETVHQDNTSGIVWGTRVDGAKQTDFRLNAKGRPQ